MATLEARQDRFFAGAARRLERCARSAAEGCGEAGDARAADWAAPVDEDDVQLVPSLLNLAPGGDDDEAEVAAEDGGASDDEQADAPLPAAWLQGEELAAERRVEKEQPAAEPPAPGLLEPRREGGEVDEVEEEDELAQLAALDRQCGLCVTHTHTHVACIVGSLSYKAAGSFPKKGSAMPLLVLLGSTRYI